MDLDTLDTQGLLDPADASLDFVRKRENLKPLAIYRIENEFLLCYDGQYAWLCSKDVSSDGLLCRVCLLCQQDWLAVTETFHGVLGGYSNRIR